ncbi:hypothetical protein AGR4C_pb20130 [Agrobacterium tumefaciens str. Kerr 14]|uniref:Uncharacterized protein n=1 Tax=Agrobacterium tumefaciens str. Kerr 14 TaxID=1183424 RepID=A0A1S7SE04_AGRTU|nr:hypothetical protein AGR4C_pb20130 [Agrobacterium tumefaciens str. Kerr 14]
MHIFRAGTRILFAIRWDIVISYSLWRLTPRLNQKSSCWVKISSITATIGKLRGVGRDLARC